MFIILLFCLVQGFTEFLPISSQGHLIIFNHTFKIDEYSDISIDTALILAHFGSLLAVITYYRKTLKRFLFSIKLIDRPDIDKDSFLLINLVISTIPIVVIGYILHEVINYNADGILLIIATSSIIFGIILYIADNFSLRIKGQNSLSYFISFLIGIFQCTALIPGVSRSGSVLTIMRFFGFQRYFTVEYSNLLSVPVILGATTLLMINSYQADQMHLILTFSSFMIFFLSFLFSVLFIFFLVSWVKKFSLLIFVIYRILFGTLILFFYV